MGMKRTALRVVVVLAVALGAGHLVQSMQKNQPGRAASGSPSLGGIEQVAAEADMVIRTHETTGPGAQPADEPVAEPAADDDQSALIPRDATRDLAAAGDCQPLMTAEARTGAMLHVTISAPCSAGAAVAFSHAGLTFAAPLDAAGQLTLDVPAFDKAGEIHALTSDGKFASATAPVADLDHQRRLAVQWVADDAFQLHMLENNASYGEPGDVNAGNPRSPAGGVMTRLGDSGLAMPMLAEIYTWPADPGITVSPVVESAVTDRTCGRRISGELLRLAADQVTLESLSFDMPGCEAVGDIMVLNNLVPEKTLASVN